MASRDNLPPAYPCEAHDHRLSALEKRSDDHSSRISKAETALADGRVEFAEVRKDLAAIQLALAEIKVALSARKDPTAWDKVSDAAIHWLVPVAMLALMWAIARSGQIPGVAP